MHSKTKISNKQLSEFVVVNTNNNLLKFQMDAKVIRYEFDDLGECPKGTPTLPNENVWENLNVVSFDLLMLSQ